MNYQNLVILDKDGTLVRPKSGEKFVQSPDDQELLPNVSNRISELKKQKAVLVIASNQGGVASGHKTLEEAIAEMRYCMQLLLFSIEEGYICPDFEGNVCYSATHSQKHDRMYPQYPDLSFRKPGWGMIKLAAIAWLGTKIKPDNSNILFIGDRPEDSQAAQSANIRFLDAEDWRQSGVTL